MQANQPQTAITPAPGESYEDFVVRAHTALIYAVTDPAVVGQDIRLNGRNYTIVGVAPREYSGSLRGLMPGVYAPIMMAGHLNPTDYDELESRGSQSLFLKGRLAPGVAFIVQHVE